MFGKDQYQKRTLLESSDRNEKKTLWEFLDLKSNILYEKSNFENVSLPLKKPSYVLNPLEIFQNPSALERRKIFFKSLNLGDVFYLKVLNEQPDCYKLLAVDKYKGCMKIDDLSIIMELPKFPQELKYLSPCPFHFIKAALSACDMKERILCVTLDDSILKKEFKNVQLGPLYRPFKAHYHGEILFEKSYADNLLMSGEMSKRKQLQEFSNLGISEDTFYSYFKKFHGKGPSFSSPSLIKKIHLQEASLSSYEQAASSFDDGDFHSTLIFLKQALSAWDENYKALLLAIKCYIEKCDGLNAFLYAEKAFKLYQKSSLPKESLFELLLRVAHVNLIQKNKHFALETYKMANIVDPYNENAFYIYNYLSNKSEI